MSGKNNPMFGKHLSHSHRRRISEAVRGENHPLYGTHRAKATKKKISEYWLGSIRPELSGKYNGAWNGGISFEPYSPEFNRYLKARIRERDNCTCLICGKRAKVVHHIDYDKKNCSEENLCVLCKGDNSRVNGDREFWQAYLSSLVRGYYHKTRKVGTPIEALF